MPLPHNDPAISAGSSEPKDWTHWFAVIVLRNLTPNKPGEPKWSLAVGPKARHWRMPCTIHQTVQEKGDATQYRYVSRNEESIASTVAFRYLVGYHPENMFDVVNNLIREVEVQPTPLWLYKALEHLEDRNLVWWGATEMKSMLERDIKSLTFREPEDEWNGLLEILEADAAHVSPQRWNGESVSSPSAASALSLEFMRAAARQSTSSPILHEATTGSDAILPSQTGKGSREPYIRDDASQESAAKRSVYWDPVRQATVDAITDANVEPWLQRRYQNMAESDEPKPDSLALGRVSIEPGGF